jgi:hypothetical protein
MERASDLVKESVSDSQIVMVLVLELMLGGELARLWDLQMMMVQAMVSMSEIDLGRGSMEQLLGSQIGKALEKVIALELCLE